MRKNLFNLFGLQEAVGTWLRQFPRRNESLVPSFANLYAVGSSSFGVQPAAPEPEPNAQPQHATEDRSYEPTGGNPVRSEYKNGSNVQYLGVESYEGVAVHNWSRSVNFTPEMIFYPKKLEDIVAIVKDANARNKRISIIGKGHSWNPLMEGSDYLIATTDLTKVWIDRKSLRVTVQAGTTIAQLTGILKENGLAVPNDIVGTSDITYGGLMATGSHGAGRNCVPMSDLVEEIEMVLPDGRVETFSAASHGAEKMDSLRLNLGLFGVMHKITFRAEADFSVEVTDRRIPMGQLFEKLPQFLKDFESVEVLWFPGTKFVTVKTWNRTHKPVPAVRWYHRLRHWLKEKAIYVIYKGIVSPTFLIWPRRTPDLMQLFGWIVFPPRTYVTDVTDAIHYIKYAQHFPINETEVALPMDGFDDTRHVQAAWDGVLHSMEYFGKQGKYPVNLIMHMRFLQGSSAYMSPAYANQATCFLDFGADYRTADWVEFVQDVWGKSWSKIPGLKLHWAKGMREYPDLNLARMYGQENVGKFLANRAAFDPKGIFASDFMRKLFDIKIDA